MKVVYDSNILIEFFGNPDLRSIFEQSAHRPSVYMSSVVAMELFAGCRTPRHRSDLASFLKPFEKAGRLITPDHAALTQSGRILALLANTGIGRAHLKQISTDVIIAVTAAKAGAVVVTRNEKDFASIAKHAPVRWISPKS